MVRPACLVSLAAVLTLAACVRQAAPVVIPESHVTVLPPDAPTRPFVHHEHGVDRTDPYHWMRDRDDPELLAYLQAENAYTAAQTHKLDALHRHLFDEMLGRIQEDDQSVPVLDHGWLTYTRTEAGRPYAIHCRRRPGPDAVEQIVLDENALADGHAYLSLGAAEVSTDGRTLAYAVDTTGRELYELRFRDLTTGAELPDVIPDIWPDLVWAHDGRTVYYSRLDDSLRPYQVVRHTLGSTAPDTIVYEETDPRFRVYVHRSRDDRWIFVGAESSTTSEVYYANAADPDAHLLLFSARHAGHEYQVESQGEAFWILTNDSDDANGDHDDRALGFQLARARPGHTDRKDWEVVVPHRPDVTLVGVEAFASFVVLSERQDGVVRFRVMPTRGDHQVIPMPEASYVAAPGENPGYDTTRFRYTYTSLTTPPSVFEYDVTSQTSERLKEQPIRGGYDREAYVSERLYATAPDGTAVPISLVRRTDTPVDGTAPLLLYGYGAYGLTIDPKFNAVRLSMLDRGVIFAIAHVRGGGFLGRAWKEAGKLAHKQNTFTDFIAAGHFLVDHHYTTHDRLAIQGGSAGGLLIGAVINQDPKLAAYAVAQVPFVDVVSTMLDASIPLTTNEWEEWGDPRDPAWFGIMRAYSPYDNVRRGPYPDLLVTSGLNDPRVQYWEPTKWVARLRDLATNDPQILLKMEMGAGHGGKTGRYGYLDDVALVQAWLLDRWGIADRDLAPVHPPASGEAAATPPG